MPQIKSAIKRVKTQKKAHLKDSSQKSALHTAIKKYKTAQKNDSEKTEELFKNAISAIDKAHSKGLIHKNKANRDKSKLSNLFNNKKSK